MIFNVVLRFFDSRYKVSLTWDSNPQPSDFRVTQEKDALDRLKESFKNRGIMIMSNLLEVNFMITVLPFQVIYGKCTKEKM